MHTLDLDTLSEERLLQSVDDDTYRLGLELFEDGHARVIDISETTARCVVQHKRNYQIQFKVEKQHLFLKCTCSHASRGLICEHDVAAWLSIRAKLIEQIPPEWQSQMARLAEASTQISATNHQQSYWLFFSLQKDPAFGLRTWQINPLVLPLNLVSESIEESGESQKNDIDFEDFFQAHPELIPRLRQAHKDLDPQSCLNATPQTVRLADLITEHRRGFQTNSHFPIEDFLPLIEGTQGELFLGDHENPLRKRIHIAHSPTEICLNIEQQPYGISIYPILVSSEQSWNIAVDQLQTILESPPWVLNDRLLVELSNPTGIELISNFQTSERIDIPTSDLILFAESYLLQLAIQIPLQGDGITWEETKSDPIPRLYLNEINGELLIKLCFQYQDFEVEYDSSMPKQSLKQRNGTLTLVRVNRQAEREQSYYDLLISNNYGLKRAPIPGKNGFFRLRARTHPVDFLLNKLPRLVSEDFEIFGEEKLKTARVNRNTPTITFSISSGIDWFDVKTVVHFGDLEVPVKELRRLVRKQERYVKLSDGSIGELPEEWLERYRHLFAVGELHDTEMRFEKHHLTLIDQALAAADQIDADREFLHRREKFHELNKDGFKGISPKNLPDGFVGELRPYQKAGYDWLHFLNEYEFGGCLADDMGLGKTIQTLVFLRSIYLPGKEPKLSASLLVVPRSLLINWQREAARFTPDLRILEFFDSNRGKNIETFNQFDLVITTYGVMLRDIQLLHGYPFHYAILDESQSIKNPLSQTARAAHLLRSKNRLVLTGTPMENSTSELWSQFAFLNPGLLGNLKYFKQEFGLPIEKHGNKQAAEKLRKIVYPFILRRTKAQVTPELPPRTERILFCDMEPAQRKMYNRVRDAYRGLLLGMIEDQGLGESKLKILEGLLRLRQISNHPKLFDEKFHGTSGKFEFILETLDTLRAEGHKVLVFSQFVQMLSLLRGSIDAMGIPYTYLDGQTQARQDQVDTFQNNPDIPFFLISLRAGGLGLNLTAADYVIHIDPWWNPAVEMQASDRTHRIGQDKPVFVFKMIARDSVEEKVLLLQERKQNLVDQIILSETGFFKDLTVEGVSRLFS